MAFFIMAETTRPIWGWQDAPEHMRTLLCPRGHRVSFKAGRQFLFPLGRRRISPLLAVQAGLFTFIFSAGSPWHSNLSRIVFGSEHFSFFLFSDSRRRQHKFIFTSLVFLLSKLCLQIPGSSLSCYNLINHLPIKTNKTGYIYRLVECWKYFWNLHLDSFHVAFCQIYMEWRHWE